MSGACVGDVGVVINREGVAINRECGACVGMWVW